MTEQDLKALTTKLIAMGEVTGGEVTDYLNRIEARCKEYGIETEGKTFGQLKRELGAKGVMA